MGFDFKNESPILTGSILCGAGALLWAVGVLASYGLWWFFWLIWQMAGEHDGFLYWGMGHDLGFFCVVVCGLVGSLAIIFGLVLIVGRLVWLAGRSVVSALSFHAH